MCRFNRPVVGGDFKRMTAPNFASGTIWTGDNLHIMRGINDDCVDLIYLDPPFNSQRNFEAPIGSQAAGAAFRDAWTLDDVDVCEHGELAERSPAAYSVIEAARQAHGKSMQAYLIMMAVRLMEMRRILKPDGSIWLHCDDAASHWLRALMDGLFGRAAFRNAVIWKRIGNHNDSGRFGRTADHLLFYGGDIRREATRVPLSADNVRSKYRGQDDRGRFRKGDLTGPGTRDGEAGEAWRNWNPTDIGRHWSVPKTGAYAAWVDANLIPGYLAEDGVLARLDMLDGAGLIVFTEQGTPELKRYLHANPGQVPPDVWTDIPPVNSQSNERTGYPTQKPLALLDRILKASSDPGDMVLDPFCGCATTLVAADRLSRHWAGIDLSPLAIRLVTDRIGRDRRGGLFGGPTALDSAPVRTDLGDLPNYRTHKHRLYGQQEGVCTGCSTHFPFRVMEVDHILPRSRGGTDHPDNLQLLCSGCNRSKGGRTMAEWRASH